MTEKGDAIDGKVTGSQPIAGGNNSQETPLFPPASHRLVVTDAADPGAGRVVARGPYESLKQLLINMIPHKKHATIEPDAPDDSSES